MKTLSIRQPWAWLIMKGFKDVENRTWRTNHRGRFLVHASVNTDRAAMARFKDQYDLSDLKFGGIIGSVELVDVVRESDSPWFEGPFGFVLRDPVPTDFVKCRGRLNFFDFNSGTLDDVVEATGFKRKEAEPETPRRT